MKTIGIIGGMSWHSTSSYYRLINEGIQKKLGGLHSAKILLSSLDFAEIAVLQNKNQWDIAGELLASHALKLQQSGADFIVIATNTMHISVPQIEQAIHIPILHIADATADAIIKAGYKSTGLLGTRFTMQMEYYTSRLQNKSLAVLIPKSLDCQRINQVIFDELVFGKTIEKSKLDYLFIIESLKQKGAECIIAGCTEITLFIRQNDINLPLFDTTAIHAQAAVDLALQ